MSCGSGAGAWLQRPGVVLLHSHPAGLGNPKTLAVNLNWLQPAERRQWKTACNLELNGFLAPVLFFLCGSEDDVCVDVDIQTTVCYPPPSESMGSFVTKQ